MFNSPWSRHNDCVFAHFRCIAEKSCFPMLEGFLRTGATGCKWTNFDHVNGFDRKTLASSIYVTQWCKSCIEQRNFVICIYSNSWFANIHLIFYFYLHRSASWGITSSPGKRNQNWLKWLDGDSLKHRNDVLCHSIDLSGLVCIILKLALRNSSAFLWKYFVPSIPSLVCCFRRRLKGRCSMDFILHTSKHVFKYTKVRPASMKLDETGSDMSTAWKKMPTVKKLIFSIRCTSLARLNHDMKHHYKNRYFRSIWISYLSSKWLILPVCGTSYLLPSAGLSFFFPAQINKLTAQ